MAHHQQFAHQFHAISHLLQLIIPSCQYLQDIRIGNAMLAMPTKLPAALTTGSQIKFPAVCINFPKHRPPECATEQALAMDCLSLRLCLMPRAPCHQLPISSSSSNSFCRHYVCSELLVRLDE